MTFNLLAPCYFRHAGKIESKYPVSFLARAKELLKPLMEEKCDLICLQKYWFEKKYQRVFENTLRDKYHIHTLKRPGSKEDGLAVFVKKKQFEIQQVTNYTFDGQRVAIFLHLLFQQQFPILLVNSHLTFPHNAFNRVVRFQQISQTLQLIQEKKQPQQMVFLCGDFNDQQDQVYQYILQNGYFSAFHAFHGQEVQVTHCNHNHGEVGVDFIFLLNSPQFQAIPRNCHLVPKVLSDKTFLQRPIFGQDWRGIDINQYDDNLVDYWSMVSDHRPLVGKFELKTLV